MSAYTYTWGGMEGFFKTSAEVAGKYIDKISGGKKITPQELVDASRSKTSPLHNEFEWNDTIAAEKYRLAQAQNIIRHLVVIKTDTEEVREARDRAYVSTGERNNVYVPLQEALSNEKWRSNLMKAAEEDMRKFTVKYYRLEKLSGVISEMKKVLSEKEAS